jgi:hypothetical protein
VPVVNLAPTPVVEVGTAEGVVWTALWPVVVELMGDVDDAVVGIAKSWLAEIDEPAGAFIFSPYFSQLLNVKKSESNPQRQKQ